MYPEILRSFLDAEVSIDWETQEDLERCADAIDTWLERSITRTYIRGYRKTDYGYMGWNYCQSGVYSLFRDPLGTSVSVNYFLAMLGSSEEECDVDVGNLL